MPGDLVKGCSCVAALRQCKRVRVWVGWALAASRVMCPKCFTGIFRAFGYYMRWGGGGRRADGDGPKTRLEEMGTSMRRMEEIETDIPTMSRDSVIKARRRRATARHTESIRSYRRNAA